jgi:hypothetical protein
MSPPITAQVPWSIFPGAKVSAQALGFAPAFNVPTNFETPKASSSIFLPDPHAPFMPLRAHRTQENLAYVTPLRLGALRLPW